MHAAYLYFVNIKKCMLTRNKLIACGPKYPVFGMTNNFSSKFCDFSPLSLDNAVELKKYFNNA